MTVVLAQSSMQLQLNENNNLRHFLTIDGLSGTQIHHLLDHAEQFLEADGTIINQPFLQDHTVMNLFFEPSTRTRTTFELAAKRLSANVLNIDIQSSSTKKGETLRDMLWNLEAMGANIFVVRHRSSGAANFIAQAVCPKVAIVNAGDGSHAHPTQAMLDMLTIKRHAKKPFSELCVAIIGDIKHSRVARSNIAALKALGVKEIRLIAPRTLLPLHSESLGVTATTHMDQGVAGADVLIALRIQNERIDSPLLASQQEFFKQYGLTETRVALAHPDAIVMHPGPMNRGIEIASSVADGAQSMILKQVNYGIAVRMAVLAEVAKTQAENLL